MFRKLKRMIITLLLLCYVPLISKQWDLVVCTVFKNESEYLEEWIEHNLDLGVDHFFLFDDASSDNYIAVLQPYLARGLITLAPLNMHNPNHDPGRYSGYQITKTNVIMSEFGHQIKWLAAIDIDEYVVPNKHDSLIAYLNEIESKVPNVGLVYIPWYNFGTSFCEKVPQGKMTEYLMLRERDGGVTGKIIYFVGRTHAAYSHHDASACAGFQKVRACFPEEIQLNHYSLRDQDFVRNVRGPLRNWDNRYPPVSVMLVNWNDVYDDAILKFRERVSED